MKVKITSKPFYKKYFKKIVVIHKNYQADFPSKSYRQLLKNKNYGIVNADIKKLISALKKYDAKFMKSIRDGKLIIYYNDDVIENIIPNHFKIREKFKPFNQEQVTLQKNDTNLEIRQQLYFKKYRYKIQILLSNKYGKHNLKIRKEIESDLSDIFDVFNIKSSYHSSIISTLYINCEEDGLFYIQMKYSDKISKICKAIILNEIS